MPVDGFPDIIISIIDCVSFNEQDFTGLCGRKILNKTPHNFLRKIEWKMWSFSERIFCLHKASIVNKYNYSTTLDPLFIINFIYWYVILSLRRILPYNNFLKHKSNIIRDRSSESSQRYGLKNAFSMTCFVDITFHPSDSYKS